jgi:hypothetical protein
MGRMVLRDWSPKLLEYLRYFRWSLNLFELTLFVVGGSLRSKAAVLQVLTCCCE